MMLSLSAARLGAAIRIKGKSVPVRPYSFGSRGGGVVGGSTHLLTTADRRSDRKHVSDTFHQLSQRFKSSVGLASSIDYDGDEFEEVNDKSLGRSYIGHAQAAEYRAKNYATSEKVASEPWMINLGRGNDNAWLMGPRNEREWFTGVAPVDECPGTFFL
jgi:hypothetical protein